MSKYTTEVRFICESLARPGVNVENGSTVDDIISTSWNKIFTTDVHFFDEEYREPLCRKILKHYYLREIGAETVGIWKLWMNTKLEEIMPYYNLLYNSAKMQFDPFKDVNVSRQHDRNVKGTQTNSGNVNTVSMEKVTGSVTGQKDVNDNNTETKKGTKSTTTTTSDHTEENGSGNTSDDSTTTRSTTTNGDKIKRDLYSETPQGALTGVENETYLTNARKVTDGEKVTATGNDGIVAKGTSQFAHTVQIDGNGSEGVDTSENNTDLRILREETSTTTKQDTSSNSTQDMTNSGNTTSTEDYIETVTGKQGSQSYSKLLQEFRETFLNIDMMVIEEFSDLFMLLW